MRPISATDLMNPEVITVRDDMTLPELARFLVDNEITGAPVVDGSGCLVGVVSLVDLAGAASGERRLVAERSDPDFFSRGSEGRLRQAELERLGREFEELRVADIMTPEVYAVEEDTPVSEIATRMLRDHLHRLLVMRQGKALGIISTSDLLGLLVDVE